MSKKLATIGSFSNVFQALHNCSSAIHKIVQRVASSFSSSFVILLSLFWNVQKGAEMSLNHFKFSRKNVDFPQKFTFFLLFSVPMSPFSHQYFKTRFQREIRRFKRSIEFCCKFLEILRKSCKLRPLLSEDVC